MVVLEECTLTASPGVIYNPLGAWLHDKVNSRRGMYITGFVGIIISTSCLAAMTSEYAGTTNRVGNGFGIFFIYLYLAFQGLVPAIYSTILSNNYLFLIEPSATLLCTSMSLRFSRPKSAQLAWDSRFSDNLLVRLDILQRCL